MPQGGRLSRISYQTSLNGVLIMENKYNPGSVEAIDAGCTCPVMDNGRGKGYMGMDGVFVYNENCEYHSEIIKKVIKEIEYNEKE